MIDINNISKESELFKKPEDWLHSPNYLWIFEDIRKKMSKLVGRKLSFQEAIMVSFIIMIITLEMNKKNLESKEPLT